jgi:hypothetical protein
MRASPEIEFSAKPYLPIIELMVKHGSKFILCHVGVRVHHLEAAHRPEFKFRMSTGTGRFEQN